MTRTNYQKKPNLLQQQKQTGQSYLSAIGYTLPEVVVTAKYPHEQRVLNTVNQARYGFNEPEFIRRLDYNDRRYIKTPYGGESTHLMTNDGNYAYPMIQDINGTLHNYDEKYGDYWNRDPKENGDYIKFQTPGDARYFAEHYKKYWPMFFKGAFKYGKDLLPGFKGGFDSFANNIGQKVYIELKKNGWYTPQRYDNIMSQLSHESAYGTSNLARNYHNYGGRAARKGQKSYKGFGVWANDDDFVKDQIQYIKNRPEMWNAQDTLSYAKAGKKYNYFKADVNDYASQMKRQVSARKAWQKDMKRWIVQQQTVPSDVQQQTVPSDATRVAKPVMKIPVPIEQPRQYQPTTYLDPTLLFDQPEEVQQPVVEDDYEASLLPSIQDAMQYFLPSQAPFANNDFMSQLVQVGLPGAKYGKDVLPGFELGTPPPEKTLNQKAIEQYEYQKRHPFLANAKNNIKKIKNEWDKFWTSNLFRFPAYLASGLVSGNVVGNGLLRARTAVRAAGRTKVPTAGGRTTYVVDPENEILGNLLGVYGQFQKTPVGALLPFKYGKDSGIHIKPSHRGRFTRYLKSHPGMTAEKAKHSKSAAVRKMATFALNTRKWRH